MDLAPPPSARWVLVVDDDEAVRRGLEFALDVAGFQVETFPSGEALLERDPPAAPLCMLIDERLPGMSGLQTLQRFRERYGRAPALLMTTYPRASLREAAAREGTPILEKPLLAEQLVAAINAQLDAEA
jgi:FixJ family two-component response regulator